MESENGLRLHPVYGEYSKADMQEVNALMSARNKFLRQLEEVLLNLDAHYEYAYFKSDPEPEEPKFSPFTGTGRRLDGKPSKNPAPATSLPSKQSQPAAAGSLKQPAASTSQSSSSQQTTGKLVFGSNANSAPKEAQKAPVKETKAEPPKTEEPKFQAFTGKKYSLKG